MAGELTLSLLVLSSQLSCSTPFCSFSPDPPFPIPSAVILFPLLLFLFCQWKISERFSRVPALLAFLSLCVFLDVFLQIHHPLSIYLGWLTFVVLHDLLAAFSAAPLHASFFRTSVCSLLAMILLCLIAVLMFAIRYDAMLALPLLWAILVGSVQSRDNDEKEKCNSDDPGGLYCFFVSYFVLSCC